MKIINLADNQCSFTNEELNCIDLSIALILSKYNTDYYFYYSFYITIYYNWKQIKIQKHNSFSIRDIFLSKMGFCLSHEVINKYEFSTYLCNKIDKGICSILLFDRNIIKNQHANEDLVCILVNGYDKEKNFFLYLMVQIYLEKNQVLQLKNG